MSSVPRVELAPGYSVARIINGCWQLSPDHGGGPASRREILDRFAELVDHGFTTFDCADIYAGTEELLGEFRRSLPDPDAIQIHTKFVPDKSTLATLDLRSIDAVIHRSIARLGVERLDLVQFHWWDYAVAGLERAFERLVELRDAGRIRLIGVTNFNTPVLRRLLEVDADIVTLQSQYSLIDRRPEREMIRCCREHGVRVLAYGTLAGGFLSAAYRQPNAPQAMNRSLQKYRLMIDEAGGWRDFQQLLDLLDDIAAKHETTLDAMAARWVLDRPSVAAIIIGIGKRARAADNRALGDLALDDEDKSRITTWLDAHPPPPGDVFDLERAPGSVHSGLLKTNLQNADDPR